MQISREKCQYIFIMGSESLMDNYYLYRAGCSDEENCTKYKNLTKIYLEEEI